MLPNKKGLFNMKKTIFIALFCATFVSEFALAANLKDFVGEYTLNSVNTGICKPKIKLQITDTNELTYSTPPNNVFFSVHPGESGSDVKKLDDKWEDYWEGSHLVKEESYKYQSDDWYFAKKPVIFKARLALNETKDVLIFFSQEITLNALHQVESREENECIYDRK